MRELDIFKKKATESYLVCFAEQCLRWKVGRTMPDSVEFYKW